MKKLITSIGFLGAIALFIGSIFKFLHYPGAGILITIGGVTIGVFFSIIYFINRIKEGKSVLLHFLIMLFISCISFAFVHKIQHWPGASCLIYTSIFISWLTVIYLIILGKKEKDEDKKFGNYIFAILLLAGFTIAIFPALMGSNQGFINYFVRTADQTNIQADTLQANLSDINKAIETKKNFYPELVKPYSEKVKELESASDSLINFIKDLRSTLISETEKIEKKSADTVHLQNIIRKDSYTESEKALLGPEIDGKSGFAAQLKSKLKNYKEFVVKSSDKIHFRFPNGLLTADNKEDDKTISWEMYTFYHKFLIQNIATLNQLIAEIIQVECTFANLQYTEANERINGYLYEKLKKANIKLEDKNPPLQEEKK
jgi:hypothetical protein